MPSLHSHIPISSIPGKVFILGEYAVLRGLPAVIAATSPRFSLTSATSGSTATRYEPASPAGRFLSSARKNLSDLSFQFNDPLAGAGGFGASTAQYALLVQQELGPIGWKKAWGLYRELMTTSGSPPSGADLVAQWEGGVQVFDPKREEADDVTGAFDWSDFLIFSATGIAGRKVATHEHLAKLENLSTLLLEKPLLNGISAVRSGSAPELGKALNQYADALHEMGFENSSAHDDRRILQKLPGILGIKGAGAMQSDAMILLCEKSADRPAIIRAAASRGLQLISEKCFPEKGIQHE